jgi:hypothetical protein
MKVIVIKREDPINFIQGNLNYLSAKMNQFSALSPFLGLDEYVLEQAMLRAYLCRDCMENGKCTVCNCTTPNMFFSPNKTDSKGKWGVMVDKDTWEEHKKNSENWTQFVAYVQDGVIKEYTSSKSKLDEFIKEFVDILAKSSESDTPDNNDSDQKTEPSTEGKE